MSIRAKDKDQMNRNDLDRAEARRWLLGNSKDFQEVCHLAGLEPDAVRDRAQAMSRRGWPGPEKKRKEHRGAVAASFERLAAGEP